MNRHKALLRCCKLDNMVNRNCLLVALLGMVLIYESTALTCLTCKDTESDESCSQGSGQFDVCSVEATFCYQRNNGGKIERGCSTELTPVEEVNNCQSTESNSCFSCTSNNCNNAPWLKCHVCDSDAAECVGKQDTTKASLCSNFLSTDQCYAKVVDNKVTRGCVSSLAAGEQACANNKYCDACTGHGCNGLSSDDLKAYPKCLVCTSLDPNCSEGTAATTECPNRDDICYTLVKEKVLYRGCLSESTQEDQNKCKSDTDVTCVTCDNEDGCNALSWLKCHQCKETETTTCAEVQADSNAGFCSAYRDLNRCFERLESGKMVRGCETDLTTPGNPCTDNAQCRVCTSNGCNKEASATLLNAERCLQCITSEDTDSSCLLGTATSQPCAKDSQNKCFSKTNSDGVLTRGCHGDLTANDISDCTGKTCSICENEGCNKNVFPTDRLRCYQCTTTETEKSCSNTLTGDPKSSLCAIYKDGDQCYSRITNGTFERGCQSSLKAAACEGLTAKQCQLCATENCNAISEDKLKGSAGRNAVSSILMAAVMAFVVFK